MIQILLAIWGFVKKVKTVIVTVWFAVHGVLRFIFRMAQAVPALLSSFPVWLLPALLICFCMGFGLFITRQR